MSPAALEWLRAGVTNAPNWGTWAQRFSSIATRSGDDDVARQRQRRNRLVALHGRELVQELVERLACLQEVEERRR
jgi:hypothetical protein